MLWAGLGGRDARDPWASPHRPACYPEWPGGARPRGGHAAPMAPARAFPAERGKLVCSAHPQMLCTGRLSRRASLQPLWWSYSPNRNRPGTDSRRGTAVPHNADCVMPIRRGFYALTTSFSSSNVIDGIGPPAN